MSFSDEALLAQILAGDTGLFEQLVTRYQKRIYSFIYRMVISEEDARDLTQEVFIQAFRALKSFRGDAAFHTWLYRIASNRTLDFLRRKKNRSPNQSIEAHPELMAGLSAEGDNPEQIVMRDEKIRRLRSMIREMPEKYRVVLILYHFENMSYQEISDALNLPVRTVATRLYRGKLLLKEGLKGETDELRCN